MKAKNIVTICGIILGGIIAVRGAGALTYQDTADVEFTFNETLSLSLTTGDLEITGLMPGVKANSNTVTATVNTNSLNGYTLSAAVGDTTTHNYTDLRVNSGSASPAFASTTSATLAEGKWGYSTCVASASVTCSTDPTVETNWAGYSGFSAVATDTVLRSFVGKRPENAYERQTNFRVGAYAASGQAEGTYTNVITFKAVAGVSN